MVEDRKICPAGDGKKVVDGICECNMEWRGTQQGEEWEDCRCTPELPCSNCAATGYVE